MATQAAKQVSRNDGYGRSTRFYEVDGKRLPSVTSILSAVNKPALVPWAAKQEREMVYAAVQKMISDPGVTRINFMRSLDAAVGHEKAHSKLMSKAGDIGSECHGLIEWNMRKELLQTVGPEPKISEKALWAFMAYEDWRKQANLSPLLVEQAVWSQRYGYAGTMDWYGEIDHEGQRLRVLGDWKTGKGIYAEALLQNAAYVHALVEMGHADPGVAGCIVRLPKAVDDPAFEVRMIPADDQKQLFKVFLSVVELWKWLDDQK